MNINEHKKTLTPTKGFRKQNNNKKTKTHTHTHTHTHNLNYDTNTNANCLESFDKWDSPN